ncbi:S8 family peptidase [Metabacillus sp. GX 13764]|uniref:S8 family peptidase n=1 Tax=Metabacillus kandeliae TaxID=2900151 RepID=UPI001E39A568|nr:S8 family peptidase [Metabacillus kandeliae]MCD7034494.1 S8 family peptidase [Metabacillus kandeliae]
MKHFLKSLIICLILCATLAAPAQIGHSAGTTNQYLVQLTYFNSKVQDSLAKEGFNVIDHYSFEQTQYAVVTGSKGLDVLQKLPFVKLAEQDQAVKAKGFSQLLPWGLKSTGAAKLKGKGCACNIAIIDSGISDHVDLKGRVKSKVTYLYGQEIKGEAADRTKVQHGTHVAGIVAANNNSIGVTGMDPNANLLIVKAMDDSGTGFLSDVSKGIAWAIEKKAQIINLSLELQGNSAILENILKKAYDKGISVVVASGNEGTGIGYPASSPYVISVGAVDESKKVTEWSNADKRLTILAPGDTILSTVNTKDYMYLSGTSMAAPYVAGAIGLILPKYTGVQNGQKVEWVKSRLQDYGEQVTITRGKSKYTVPSLNIYKSYYSLK